MKHFITPQLAPLYAPPYPAYCPTTHLYKHQKFFSNFFFFQLQEITLFSQQLYNMVDAYYYCKASDTTVSGANLKEHEKTCSGPHEFVTHLW